MVTRYAAGKVAGSSTLLQTAVWQAESHESINIELLEDFSRWGALAMDEIAHPLYITAVR